MQRINTFSRSLFQIPRSIPSTRPQATAIQKFVKKIMLHGTPQKILTDQGTNFSFEEIFKLLL